MKRTSIKKVIVYYGYWANIETFGVRTIEEDAIEIIVEYETGRRRRFYFGGAKGIRLPLAAIEETVPKSVKEFINKAKKKKVYEYRERENTPFDQFTFE